MRRLGSLLSCLALVSSCLLSCGDDEKDKLSDVEGFCREWAVETCNGTIVERCSRDEEDCRAAQQEFCEDNDRLGSGSYARSEAERCLNAVAEAFVDGELTAAERATFLSLGGDCEGIISGPGDEGSRCNEHRDCDTTVGLRCIIKDGETNGECHEPQMQEGGDPCNEPNQVCAEGFFCDGENCLRRRAEGATCSESQPCNEDNICPASGEEPAAEADAGAAADDDDDDEEAERMCAPKGENGDDCDTDAQCLSSLCAQNGRCVQRLPVLATDNEDLCQYFR